MFLNEFINLVWIIGIITYMSIFNKKFNYNSYITIIGLSSIYILPEIISNDTIIYILSIIMIKEIVERKELSRDISIGIIITIVGSIIIIHSNEYITTYIGIEMQTLPYYWIISGTKTTSSLESGIKYYSQTAISTSMILMGIIYNYKYNGNNNINNINNDISIKLIEFGIIWKIGLVPMHYWIFEVYQGTNSYSIIGLSTYIKYSMVIIGITIISISNNKIIIIASLLSILIGGIIGIIDNNIKRLQGSSTLMNMGWIMVSIGNIKNEKSIKEYMVIYMICAIVIIEELTTRKWLIEIKGSRNQLQWSIPMLISMMGIPPIIMFYMKLNILKLIIDSNNIILAWLIITVSLIGIYMYYRILITIWLKKINLKKHDRINQGIIREIIIIIILTLGIIPEIVIY